MFIKDANKIFTKRKGYLDSRQNSDYACNIYEIPIILKLSSHIINIL